MNMNMNMNQNMVNQGMGMNRIQNPMPYWNTLPQYNIIQVNGENGANAFQMGPNSKVLLLDETAPIVWFVQTDGAGYKTVTPYDIAPHQLTPPVNLNDLESRIAKLEERLDATIKSNSSAGRNTKRQRNDAVADATANTTTTE